MESPTEYLVFDISGRNYAVDLAHVEKVFRAAAPVPIPRCPESVLGAINIRGTTIALLNLRRIFGLEDKPLAPEDRIVVFSIDENTRFAGVVDGVEGVVSWSDEQIGMRRLFFSDSNHFFDGVGRFEGRTVAICRMDRIPVGRGLATDPWPFLDDDAKAVKQ